MKTNINEEWEQPIPFNTTLKLPNLPINCLPLTVKNYVNAVTEATQTPVDMAGVAALAVMSVCVQGKYMIEAKSDWREPLNLYSIIVAKPAERKSVIMTLLTKYLKQYQSEWNEEHKLKIERNKTEKKALEKAVERLKDKFANKGDIEIMKELMRKQDELTNFKELHKLRLLTDDTTPEVLISLLENNSGKMAVISSEGGIFDIIKGRYSQSVNMDVFLKAHTGDDIEVDRKGREHESIKNPCLTVLLSVQPIVLEGLMANEIFRGRGLPARFLYCIPTSKMGSREYETQPIPEKYKQDYKKLCYDLLDLPINNTPDVLRLGVGARILSTLFAKNLEPRFINDLENMSDFVGKFHGAIVRIAGILHLANGYKSNQLISFETMNNAIKIGDYFLEHAKVAYRLMGADKQLKDAKYILKQLEEQRVNEIKRSKILRLCRPRFKNDEDMTSAFELLTEYGYIRKTETTYGGKGRKPSPNYNINPLIYMD